MNDAKGRTAVGFFLMMVLNCSSRTPAPVQSPTPRTITSVRLVSMSWDALPRASEIGEDDLEGLSFVTKQTIVDRAFGEAVRTRYLRLGPWNGTESSTIIRMLATINYDTGLPDRLAIPDDCRSMLRNGVRRAFDPDLFQMIAAHLTLEEKTALVDFPECDVKGVPQTGSRSS